jgi:23S rRNA (cytosine1962-C5)-methyltransferase
MMTHCTMPTDSVTPLLASALAARADLFDARHASAFRLFNGFFEGCSDLVVDLYARTLVLHNYAEPPESAQVTLAEAKKFLQSELSWTRTTVLKTRNAADLEARRGVVLCGEAPDRRVRDPGSKVWYAIDLLLNRDASFYLDTRNLRAWAQSHLADKTVLNTFAYTGSLGVAALAGGASRIVHLDASRVFLNVAKTSYALNGFPIHRADFQTGDFFTQVSHLKRASERFDCVFVDPPFFSTTRGGTVDLVHESHRVINKVRPLVNDSGYLVAVNNALFVSGADYIRTLETLCADGYLSIEELIPVPPDFTGYPETIVRAPPVDPAPFNHSTKIAVLRVRRKAV